MHRDESLWICLAVRINQYNNSSLPLIVWGGGRLHHTTQNLEKVPVNNTALIKTNIPVLYCLSHDKDLKVQFKMKKITFDINTQNTTMELFNPNTIRELKGPSSEIPNSCL